MPGTTYPPPARMPGTAAVCTRPVSRSSVTRSPPGDSPTSRAPVAAGSTGPTGAESPARGAGVVGAPGQLISGNVSPGGTTVDAVVDAPVAGAPAASGAVADRSAGSTLVAGRPTG